jgi:hypothetical protein
MIAGKCQLLKYLRMRVSKASRGTKPLTRFPPVMQFHVRELHNPVLGHILDSSGWIGHLSSVDHLAERCLGRGALHLFGLETHANDPQGDGTWLSEQAKSSIGHGRWK